jgi:hypothetical protein
MKFKRSRWLIPCFLLLVGACETAVEGRNFAQISFAHMPPIKLDVAKIDVREAAPEAPGNGNIEHELPVSLRGAARSWARERLQAVGQSGTAVVTVEQADFKEERLTKTKGLKGIFTTDQVERYRARLTLSVMISSPTGSATARAMGSRSQTVPEDASLADREKVWFSMTEKLVKAVDAEMEKRIRKNLHSYLR